MTHPAPIHVGDLDDAGYQRVVFLDGVGSHDHPVVIEGVQVTPITMPRVPVFDQNNLAGEPIGYQDAVTIDAVVVHTDGARDFSLAGPLAAIRVDGEEVWTASD